MTRILFLRDYVEPAGGHIKVRDFFEHCLLFPGLVPDIYFTVPSYSAPHWDEFFGFIPPERIVPEIDLGRYDLLFLAGMDWELIARDAFTKPIINLVQGFRHVDPSTRLFGFLKNHAHRICASTAIQEVILPHANGPTSVIAPGFTLKRGGARAATHAPLDETMARDRSQPEVNVLILAIKNPGLGSTLRAQMKNAGIEVEVITSWIPREQFLQRLSETDVFVGLPFPTEGFYLPALEAMACGCAVVCPDVRGNRDYCQNGVNCLQPAYEHLEDFVQCVHKLWLDVATRKRLSAAALRTAARYSLQHERKQFFELLSRLLISSK